MMRSAVSLPPSFVATAPVWIYAASMFGGRYGIVESFAAAWRSGGHALGTTLKQRAATSRKPPAAAPSAADDLYKRGQAAAAQGDLDAARELLGSALKRDEKHAGAHTLLGFTLGQQGDLRSGIAHLERAIALDPASAEAHYNLGVALW